MADNAEIADRLISTGEAAKLCSVTADTVLKWIKRGRLRAQQTVGGHYRIDREDLKRFKLTSTSPRERRPAYERQFRYCWEYNSEDGRPLPGCLACAVYSTRAQRCYEVIKLAAENGHQKLFCTGSCETCDYYKRVREQNTNVLVITGDQILSALLKRDAPSASFNLETTDCEYTCSALVDSFRPDYAIIDCSLGPQRAQDICAHLLQDPRIPFVRVILAAEPGGFPKECDRAIFARLAKPFSIEDIGECLEGLRHEESLVDRQVGRSRWRGGAPRVAD